MLYTVVPLERIYTPRTENNSENSNKKVKEYKDINIQYGRIKAKRNKDHYIVERIESTDMSDYLREEYSPGAVIDIE